jgi:hypothetical protein
MTAVVTTARRADQGTTNEEGHEVGRVREEAGASQFGQEADTRNSH